MGGDGRSHRFHHRAGVAPGCTASHGMLTALFESFGPQRHPGWDATFSSPLAVHEARCVDEVAHVIAAAEQAALAGDWAVLLLAYEAAPAFDAALPVHSPSNFPLAWAAIFDTCGAPEMVSATPIRPPLWEPLLPEASYHAAIAQIREAIAAGETWQVNYSFPLRTHFSGDTRSWYRNLTCSQQAGYCAWIDLGHYQVLSLSPELFFERTGMQVRVRPMKGTRPRGRTPDEDHAQRRQLLASEKDRAENLMIVDLLRNDLGRIALPGTVRTSRLFEVETYDTVFQMTSTIEAQTRPGLPLFDLLRGLFPCGSITGAPKVRTMEWIRRLEPFPRDLYTGAIGWLRPGGDCIFNVAIRTIVREECSNEARCGVGGGITWDSTAEDEYQECLAKARFLTAQRPAFDLLESLLLENGQYWLLERHLQRMGASAEYFGFPWKRAAVQQTLTDLQAQHREGRWKVRLLTSAQGGIMAEAQALPEPAAAVRQVALAEQPVDDQDVFLYHKTTHRAVYEQRRRSGCDDTILYNQRGEVTESLIANVVLRDEQGLWTPPVSCGLLPGCLRTELLARDEIRERVITVAELQKAPTFFLVNSVRGWMQAAWKVG